MTKKMICPEGALGWVRPGATGGGYCAESCPHRKLHKQDENCVRPDPSLPVRKGCGTAENPCPQCVEVEV